MNFEEALKDVTEVVQERDPNGSTRGIFLNKKGEHVGGFFSCVIDELSMAEGQYEADCAEYLRQQEPLFDPNKIDPRNVHKELGDRVTIINLGHRVNKIKKRFV